MLARGVIVIEKQIDLAIHATIAERPATFAEHTSASLSRQLTPSRLTLDLTDRRFELGELSYVQRSTSTDHRLTGAR